MLPKSILKVKVPPLKIQGIKTKLVPFIAESVIWDGKGTYFEPFMGSGVVGFNLAPQKAIFSDSNPYIIQFYRDIQDGKITSKKVRLYLEEEALKLAATPENKDSYYYEVRNRFNETHDSLDFLFLQRSNFNGMIRFNNKGEYNVPFGRKPERFKKALITKICNQVLWVEELLKDKDWEFKKMSFVDAFKMMGKEDFVYLDPPYINRYDGYYDPWNEDYANLLAKLTQEGKAGYAFSMWYQNEYRKNNHMAKWSKGTLLTTEHFYHLGAKESNRNSMLEALVVSNKNVNQVAKSGIYYQESLF
ncbi:Dam family site-specific DNA-(adenine-N6)-methyltransferase [Listeria innocua]|nr:Dam family site-specific DNA-(adenine-N6)-methyltransferase [Listeria innocua]EIU0523729.1 Dam family site-specific DNA-(adenine-N6)-methyltransferase [Listeria innocua]